MKDFHLAAVAQIRHNDEVITLNSDGKSIPLEHDVMIKAQHCGRIIESANRIFINYPNFSILIKNIPIDNPDLAGRLRDHLTVIAKASDSRVSSLIIESNLKQHVGTSDIFEDTSTHVEIIKQSLDIHAKDVLEISEHMGHKIEEKLLYLGLEEDQEKQLMDIVDETIHQLQHLVQKQETIKNEVEYILKNMNNALGRTK